ncbi:MAG: InlB B-repeat-containing protein [Spirochaetales bacterium]|nr:InlB B-repeat-containing protein [Spirochaetales bacterium]
MKKLIFLIPLLMGIFFFTGCPDSSSTVTTETYNLTYDANGATEGTAPIDNQNYEYGDTSVIRGAGTLLKTDYTFLGWNTLADGSGSTYSEGDNFTITGDITLYAEWEEITITPTTYTVTYMANGASDGTVPVDSTDYSSGASVTILGSNTLEKTDYTFEGWNTSSDGSGTSYSEGDSFSITSNVVLYATWEEVVITPETYTVTYMANGASDGSVPTDSNSYESGDSVTVLGSNTLEKTDYTFEGWNTSSFGTGTSYSEGDSFTITGDEILYAEWESVTSSLPSKTFRALDATDYTFYDCKSYLYAETDHCQIYVEDGADVSVSTAESIADEFENNIYPKITTNFGDESDVDGNGKIILLYLDIQDGFSGSGGYIGGYFHSLHCYSTSVYEDSNEADMIFLDTYPSTAGSDSSNETVAHEFQHLINFNVNALVGGSAQDTWVNEGLSSAAEYVYSEEVSTSRVDYYNTDPYAYDSDNLATSIVYGNNFFRWNNDLEDYATVSLFFQWLRIHDPDGIGIYKEILNSSYSDYQAVTEATSSWTDTSYSDFADWGDLLSTWMAANVRNDSTGYLGYEGEVTDSDGNPPTPLRFSSQNNYEWGFYPGNRILSTMPSEGYSTPSTAGTSGTNIEYVGIPDSGDLDRTSPYTGTYAIVYNSNPDYSDSYETGFVANVETIEPLLSKSATSNISLPETYKIDMPFDKNGLLIEE